MNMNFSTNKTYVEVIKEELLEELILETFTLILIIDRTEINENNLMSSRILGRSIMKLYQ